MSLPIWIVRLIKFGFPYRFSIARLSKVPLLRNIIKYLFFHKDKIILLPQNKTVKLKIKIDIAEDFENIVLPSQIVKHFIEQSNYHFIMNFCICRDSAHCSDYPIHLGCLFLGRGVLDINPKLGRLVSKKDALEHIRQCQDAGLVHLIGRNKLDKIWLGVRHGHQLLTICNCCPCCCLWKMLPYLGRQISSNVTRMPGVRVEVTSRCTGCGTCTQGTCFVDAIHLENNVAVISEECRGCGRCVSICPNNAIEMRIDDQVDFVRDSIDRIAPLVDLI
jgi:ferredoxin